jgi:peptidoglycan/xylan/chitin deacetylase (PgdA/CDA1 family)
MSLLHHESFSSWARGHLLCRIEGVEDRFALTFDDGPNPRATGVLLDLLARHEARATFFLLGGNVRRWPGLVRRLVADGHEAGLHGDTHLPLAFLPPWAIRSELRRSAATVAHASGSVPRFYRPPFGFMMPGQSMFVRSLGFEPVLGDVYPEDPQRPGVGEIVARVMPRLRGGSILILHDGSPFGNVDREQTLEALDIILEEAETRNLRAVSVGELWRERTPRGVAG